MLDKNILRFKVRVLKVLKGEVGLAPVGWLETAVLWDKDSKVVGEFVEVVSVVNKRDTNRFKTANEE